MQAGFTVKKIRYWDIAALPVLFLTRVLNKIIIQPEGLTHPVLDKLLDKWFLFYENKEILPLGANIILIGEK